MKGYGGGGIAELNTVCVNLESHVFIREVCRELSLNVSQDASMNESPVDTGHDWAKTTYHI